MIKDDEGQHTINMVSGGKLIAMMKGDKIELKTRMAVSLPSPSPTSSSPTA